MILLGDKWSTWWIYFLLISILSVENCILSPCFFLHYDYFIMYSSLFLFQLRYFWWKYFLNNFNFFDGLLSRAWLYTSSSATKSECICLLSDDTCIFFNNSVYNTSTFCQSNSPTEHSFFSFSSDIFTYEIEFFLFWPFVLQNTWKNFLWSSPFFDKIALIDCSSANLLKRNIHQGGFREIRQNFQPFFRKV